ncbi:MAG: hypothetical protein AB4368_02970 [Xenococcaceae cyanobacterium]
MQNDCLLLWLRFTYSDRSSQCLKTKCDRFILIYLESMRSFRYWCDQPEGLALRDRAYWVSCEQVRSGCGKWGMRSSRYGFQ